MFGQKEKELNDLDKTLNSRSINDSDLNMSTESMQPLNNEDEPLHQAQPVLVHPSQPLLVQSSQPSHSLKNKSSLLKTNDSAQKIRSTNNSAKKSIVNLTKMALTLVKKIKKHIYAEENKTGGIIDQIDLTVGCRVMLRRKDTRMYKSVWLMKQWVQ